MIRVESLVKQYGKHPAVNGISFEVKKGEIVGFLGPNGAGKTTTMRVIAGFLMPTSGDVWVADRNMATDSAKCRGLSDAAINVRFGTTDQCLRAAVKGYWEVNNG